MTTLDEAKAALAALDAKVADLSDQQRHAGIDKVNGEALLADIARGGAKCPESARAMNALIYKTREQVSTIDAAAPGIAAEIAKLTDEHRPGFVWAVKEAIAYQMFEHARSAQQRLAGDSIDKKDLVTCKALESHYLLQMDHCAYRHPMAKYRYTGLAANCVSGIPEPLRTLDISRHAYLVELKRFNDMAQELESSPIEEPTQAAAE